jgi:hypothetical protein
MLDYMDQLGFDLTPTWVEAMKILILVLETGNPEGRAMAKEELMLLAEAMDQLEEEEE